MKNHFLVAFIVLWAGCASDGHVTKDNSAHVEPFINDDMKVWFYNPYSNDNEDATLANMGWRLKKAGFSPSTRIIIYTDLKVMPELRAQARASLINSHCDFENFDFYDSNKEEE